jgi:hypothetical protein
VLEDLVVVLEVQNAEADKDEEDAEDEDAEIERPIDV